jgi:hypothetical protein
MALFRGTNAADTLIGTGGDDTQLGFGGNDRLFGEDGNDLLRGYDGDDLLVGRDGNDRLDGGDGNDALNGGRDNDLLLGRDGRDQLVGSTGNDRLFGDAGDDRLFGGDGNDLLDGGAGDDVIIGHAGRDIMRGRAGADVFVTAPTGGVPDVVLDFVPGEDILDLSRLLVGFRAESRLAEWVDAEVFAPDRTMLWVNRDGQGDDWERLCELRGVEMTVPFAGDLNLPMPEPEIPGAGASKSSEDGQVGDSFGARNPALSFDGRFVAYGEVPGTSVDPPDPILHNILLRDSARPDADRLLASFVQDSSFFASGASIAGDAREVAFEALFPSNVSRIIALDTVADRQLASIQLNSDSNDRFGITGTALSTDGRWLAYVDTAADNPNGPFQVFLEDLHTPGLSPILVSVRSGGGGGGNGDSVAPAISEDGRYVAFESRATNLVDGPFDGNGQPDVFRFDRLTGEILLVSTADGAGASTANADSRNATISADGSVVAFDSAASNLAPDSNGAVRDVFVARIGAAGVTSLEIASLSEGGQQSPDSDATDPSLSADGKRLAFLSEDPDLVFPTLPIGGAAGLGSAYVKDLASGRLMVAHRLADVGEDGIESLEIALSGDGSTAAVMSRAPGRIDDPTAVPVGRTLFTLPVDFEGRGAPEIGDDTGDAATLLRSRFRSFISTTDDHDWLEVGLLGGRSYRIDVLGINAGAGRLIDPELAVRDGAGRLLASDSDDGAGRNALLRFDAPRDGRYFLDVSGKGASVGTYEVRIADDIAGNTSTTSSFTAGGRVDGRLEYFADIDWHRVRLAGGTTHEFVSTLDLDSPGPGRARMELRDASGQLLGADEVDGVPGTGTRMGLFLDLSGRAGGDFFLAFRGGVSGDALGDYRMVSLIGDYVAEGIGTDQPLNIRSTKVSGIDFAGDRDWFRIELEAGARYSFQVATQDPDPLTDSRLRVLDQSGDAVTGAVDGEGGLDFAPVVSGRYFLEIAAGPGDVTGGYRIFSDELLL